MTQAKKTKTLPSSPEFLLASSKFEKLVKKNKRSFIGLFGLFTISWFLDKDDNAAKYLTELILLKVGKDEIVMHYKKQSNSSWKVKEAIDDATSQGIVANGDGISVNDWEFAGELLESWSIDKPASTNPDKINKLIRLKWVELFKLVN